MYRIVAIAVFIMFVVSTVALAGDAEWVEIKPKQQPKSKDVKSISIKYDMPKKQFKLSEPFYGKAEAGNTGPDFNGVIIYTMNRNGFEENIFHNQSKEFKKGMYTSLTFQAFHQNEHGYTFEPGQNYFDEEGTYRYTISIYSCSDIRKVFQFLDKQCIFPLPSNDTSKLISEEIAPLKSSSIDIVVKGGVKLGYFGDCCKSDADCHPDFSGGCKKNPSTGVSSCAAAFGCETNEDCALAGDNGVITGDCVKGACIAKKCSKP